MALVCYHGDNPHVINQDRADIVLNAIADPERRKIITSIKKEFKTAHQISGETQIPIGTTYRKIRELYEKNLLISSGKINEHGRKEFAYKSKIQKVTMIFEDDFLDVKIYTNLRD